MTVTKWVLSNPVALTSHTFEINPDPKGPAGEFAPQKKLIEARQTRTGLAVGFQQDSALHGSFTLTILDKTEYSAIWSWWNQGQLLHLVDDLARTFTIYLTGFRADRERKAGNAWFHTITADYVITAVTDI